MNEQSSKLPSHYIHLKRGSAKLLASIFLVTQAAVSAALNFHTFSTKAREIRSYAVNCLGGIYLSE